MSTVSESAGDTQRTPPTQAQRTAEAKKAFIASLNSAGQTIDTELQGRAKNIHANAEALSKQEKEVDKQAKKLAKEGDALQKFLDKSNKKLAAFDNLGEVQEGLDDDLDDLEAMLAAIEGKSSQDGSISRVERTSR